MVQSGETPMTHGVYRGHITLQLIVESDHLPCRDGVSAEKLCRFSAAPSGLATLGLAVRAYTASDEL